MAGQIAQLALLGLPPRQLGSYIADVNRVTPEMVRAAAQRHFDPAHMDLVVVGDARLFYDELARARPNAERIPVTELNLDRESLR
jgi:zinc protease